MSTASMGRTHEYKVRDDLVHAGWVTVMRAAASKGVADLLMAHDEYGAALVQVGSRTKTISPLDRARFVRVADMAGATPVLAIVTPRQPIRYWHVTCGTAGSWDEWSP